jgi:hypothetical protein
MTGHGVTGRGTQGHRGRPITPVRRRLLPASQAGEHQHIWARSVFCTGGGCQQRVVGVPSPVISLRSQQPVQRSLQLRDLGSQRRVRLLQVRRLSQQGRLAPANANAAPAPATGRGSCTTTSPRHHRPVFAHFILVLIVWIVLPTLPPAVTTLRQPVAAGSASRPPGPGSRSLWPDRRPDRSHPALPRGAFHPEFLDKNGRDIGKSQSRRAAYARKRLHLCILGAGGQQVVRALVQHHQLDAPAAVLRLHPTPAHAIVRATAGDGRTDEQDQESGWPAVVPPLSRSRRPASPG